MYQRMQAANATSFNFLSILLLHEAFVLQLRLLQP